MERSQTNKAAAWGSHPPLAEQVSKDLLPGGGDTWPGEDTFLPSGLPVTEACLKTAD